MAIENLTTYTKNDPSSVVSISASNTISVTNARKDAAYQVYKDKGVGHFAGAFTHKVSLLYSSWGNYGPCGFCWALANVVVTKNLSYEANVLYAGGFYWNYTNSSRIIVGEPYLTYDEEEEEWNRSTNCDWYGNITTGVPYYLTIERNPLIGSNGVLYGRVYSDAARTVLLHTIIVALHSNTDYRYIYAAEGGRWQDLGSSLYSMEAYDLDVGDPEEGASGPVARIGPLLGVGMVGL